MPASPRKLEDFLYPEPENREIAERLVREAVASHAAPAKMLTTTQLEDLPDPAWFLERFIQEDSLSIVYGPPKTGKTFLCVEWANRLALGVEWLGHKAMPVRVLYASAEGNKSLGMRTRALRAYHKLPVAENLRWLPGVTQLYYQGDRRPQPQQELILAINEFQPHVVFFDTLARHTPGGDVASNHDMSKVVQVADELRAGFGCSIVFVHHTRKDGGDYLGATALYGAADCMIQLEPSDTRGKFELNVIAKELDDYKPPWTFELLATGGSAVVSEGTRYMGGRAEAVLAYIAEAGEVTAAQVQSAVYGADGKDAANFIKLLAAEGRIVVAGEKAEGRGRPAKLWKIVENDAQYF